MELFVFSVKQELNLYIIFYIGCGLKMFLKNFNIIIQYVSLLCDYFWRRFPQKCEYNKISQCVILSDIVFYKFLTSAHHSKSEEPISAVGGPMTKNSAVSGGGMLGG